MPKSSPSGGSLDPPEYSKISGLLQRLDSIDGMDRFGPISASEAARAILVGPRGGAKCQNYNITADVCSKLPASGPNRNITADVCAKNLPVWPKRIPKLTPKLGRLH